MTERKKMRNSILLSALTLLILVVSWIIILPAGCSMATQILLTLEMMLAWLQTLYIQVSQYRLAVGRQGAKRKLPGWLSPAYRTLLTAVIVLAAISIWRDSRLSGSLRFFAVLATAGSACVAGASGRHTAGAGIRHGTKWGGANSPNAPYEGVGKWYMVDADYVLWSIRIAERRCWMKKIRKRSEDGCVPGFYARLYQISVFSVICAMAV